MTQRTKNNPPFGWRELGKSIEDLTELYEMQGGTISIDITGASDVSASLQSVIDGASTGDTIKIPSGKIRLESQVNIDKELYIVSDSCSVEVIGDISAFFIDSDNVTVKGFNFHSSDAANGAEAITVNSKNRFNISDCNFSDLDYGVRFYSTRLTGTNELSIIHNSYFVDCNYGIVSEEGGEYTNITSCRLHNCNVGVSISGGNVTLIGCNITFGLTGVELLAGANNSHGIISGCEINHTSTPIKADGMTKGHTIVGCHLYQGDINLKDSIGVCFDNCVIVATNFWADNCTALFFKNCRIWEIYGFSVDLSKNGNPSTVISHNNYIYDTGAVYSGI